jgi:hypothetical protein
MGRAMTLRVALFTTGTRFERRMTEGFGTASRAAMGTSTFVEPAPPDRSGLLTGRRGAGAWHQQAKPPVRASVALAR